MFFGSHFFSLAQMYPTLAAQESTSSANQHAAAATVMQMVSYQNMSRTNTADLRLQHANQSAEMAAAAAG